MTHPDRQRVFDALDTLDEREWPDCLASILGWAEVLTFVDPDDPTPAPAAVKAAVETELARLKGLPQ